MVNAAVWGAPLLAFMIIFATCFSIYMYRRDPRRFHHNMDRCIACVFRRKASDTRHNDEIPGGAGDTYGLPRREDGFYRGH